MGLQLKELVVKEEISIKDLKGKVLAIDSMNYLYQFLTTIRTADGSLLTDKKGRVTSHLIGLFNRTTSLMEQGLKLVFVFDGKAPEVKRKTWEKRWSAKNEAFLKLKEAEEKGNLEEMRKFAPRTAVLNKEMIADAKKVIGALGLPIIQAPSEGEAQTAYLVKKGDAFASVSQDYDNLIFDCPLLIRNLSIVGRQKKIGKAAYRTIKPEVINLKKVLDHLEINLSQLRALAILMGTDYNPGGVKGIGPKTALKMVKKHQNDFESLFKEANWLNYFPELSWKDLIEVIENIPVTDNYDLKWHKINLPEAIKLLVSGHDFNPEKVEAKLKKLEAGQNILSQQGLKSFFQSR